MTRGGGGSSAVQMEDCWTGKGVLQVDKVKTQCRNVFLAGGRVCLHASNTSQRISRTSEAVCLPYGR